MSKSFDFFKDKSIYFNLEKNQEKGILKAGARIEKLIIKNEHYQPEAYGFVIDALRYTMEKLDEHRHVNGRELLEGIREYALEQFGPMTRTVLESWGVRETMDFGEIVFSLVEAGFMRKRRQDGKEEFRNVYDFRTAFDEPYKIN